MGLNILVVDDSSIVRKMVRRSIEMSDLEVSTYYEAASGSEALQILAESWVDIVFADLHMPGMGGVEMVQKMAEDQLLETVPVVIVSSDHSATRIDSLKQKGIRAYIKKPFRPEHFKLACDKILAQGESREFITIN